MQNIRKSTKTKLLHNAKTWEKCLVIGYDENKQCLILYGLVIKQKKFI